MKVWKAGKWTTSTGIRGLTAVIGKLSPRMFGGFNCQEEIQGTKIVLEIFRDI